MNAEDIKKILIAGAGTMGQSIGLSCVTNGCCIAVYDIKNEILAKARNPMKKKIDKVADFGTIPKGKGGLFKDNVT